MPAPEIRETKSKAGPPLAGLLLAGGILLATLLMQSVPGAAETLQWQRHGGSPLAWLTGHLCHWSWDHLAWDLFAFGLLSLLAWRVAPSRYVPSLLLAALLIPLEIRLNQPQFDSYRGLSGLDCALFGLIVASLWQPPTGDRSGIARKVLALLGASGFLAKTIYEFTTGHTVFIEMGPSPTFIPALSAHLVGFACGVAAGLEYTKPIEFEKTLPSPQRTPCSN
jgi:hypothetical protein